MSRSAAFRRKVIYLLAIAALLAPLYFFGAPRRATEEGGVAGGQLAAVRSKHQLSQGDLGKIDPTSETMKLATFGLRGVAANLLWSQANEYKKTHQYDKMKAAIEQITRLQPNFIKVWEFQSHNLAYNTSVEYDDYRLRYHWIKHGIDFLLEGTTYNRDEPRLLWYLGWTTQQKIGRADEKRYFRPLFSADKEFHKVLADYIPMEQTYGPHGDQKPDNWLVGHQWMLKAQRVVDQDKRRVMGVTPLVFHADPPMSLMYYAIAIENDGVLDERARAAWQDAAAAWRKYGEREIQTSEGFYIRLNSLEEDREQLKQKTEEFRDLLPGVIEKVQRRRIADFDPTVAGATFYKLETDLAERKKERERLQDDLAAALERIADVRRQADPASTAAAPAEETEPGNPIFLQPQDSDFSRDREQLLKERVELFEKRASVLQEELEAKEYEIKETTTRLNLVEQYGQPRISREAVEALSDRERYTLGSGGIGSLDVTFQDAARAADKGDWLRAWDTAVILTALLGRVTYCDRYRDIVNFEYWRTRAEVEQTTHAIKAREYVFEADRLFREESDFEGSRMLYERAWDLWAVIFEVYPELLEDTTAEELMESVKRYREVLAQLDEPNLNEHHLPRDFPLMKLVRLHDDLLERQTQQLERQRNIEAGNAAPQPPQKKSQDDSVYD